MTNTETATKDQRTSLTIEEMATVLGVHKSWIYSRTKLGQKGIPHFRVGKYLRFYKDKVLDFLEQQAGI